MELIDEATIEIMKKALILRETIDELAEDEDERITWYLAIAADLLHDVPYSLVEKFMNSYKTLRKEVKMMVG